MKAPLDEMPARLAALIDERRKLERELTDAKKKLAMGGGAKAGGEANGVQMVGDVKLMARAVSGIDIKDLKSLADEGKKQLGSGVVALVGVTDEGKAGIVVGVTNDLTARFNAVDLVKKGAEALGGKGGGGRPDMAQAGGPDGAKADAALAAIAAALGGVMRGLVGPPLRRRIDASMNCSALTHGAFRDLGDRSAIERAEGNRRRFRRAARGPKPVSSSRPMAALIGAVFCITAR